MSRLFNLSNRVNIPDKGSAAIAGGLDNTLSRCRGFNEVARFGWSGKLVPDEEYDFSRPARHLRSSRRLLPDGQIMTYYVMDMPEKLFRAFYEDTANNLLWPAMHGFPELSVNSSSSRAAYEKINMLYLQGAKSVLRDYDELLVHDYHFMPFARLARESGLERPIGFYLHIPVPNEDVLFSSALHPDTAAFIRKLFVEDLPHYDMIGFQSSTDLDNYERVAGTPLMPSLAPYETRPLHLAGRTTLAGVFPATCDIEEVKSSVAASLADPSSMLFLINSSQGRWQKDAPRLKLCVAADRLDYTKGLPMRLEALRRLQKYKKFREDHFFFFQAAPQSRANIPAYKQEIKRYQEQYNDLRTRFGNVVFSPQDQDGNFSPSRRESVLAAYRHAEMVVCTSIADGMHLGPKESTAGANPDNPSACVMTNTIGAAHEFEGCAVIVDPEAGAIAEGMKEAASLPRKKRILQHTERLEIMDYNNNERWLNALVENTRKGSNFNKAKGNNASMQPLAALVPP